MIARNMLLDQAAYGLEIIELCLRFGCGLQHSLSNGKRNNDLIRPQRALTHICSRKMRKLERL